MKTMLQKLEEDRQAYVAEKGRDPSIMMKTSVTNYNSRMFRLISVGSDFIEVQSDFQNSTPFLLDRKQVKEISIVRR